MAPKLGNFFENYCFSFFLQRTSNDLARRDLQKPVYGPQSGLNPGGFSRAAKKVADDWGECTGIAR